MSWTFIIALLISCTFIYTITTKDKHTNEIVGPFEIATVKQKCILQGYNIPIRIHRCAKTTVLVNSCLGACLSLHCPRQKIIDVDSRRHVSLQNISHCCHVTRFVNVTIVMHCLDFSKHNYFISHVVQSATACGCRKCHT